MYSSCSLLRIMSLFISVITAFILLLSTPSFSQSDDCVFIDTLTNEHKLDLSPLINTQLFYWDGSTYNYTYTVCANTLECKPLDGEEAIVSIKQGEPNSTYPPTRQDCWWLAKWDEGGVQPSYNPTLQSWTFQYSNGMPCPGEEGSPRETKIIWKCNPNVAYIIIYAHNTSECGYEIGIESVLACIDIPPPYCKWFAQGPGGNSITLDLTPLSNTTMIGIDDNNPELVFAYTPCKNGTKCDDTDVMAKIENVTTSDGCDTYIAIWDDEDNGGLPEYGDGVWKFTYNNGQNCGELTSELYIYWFCNPNISTYVVEKTNIIEPCLYDINIATSLACV